MHKIVLVVVTLTFLAILFGACGTDVPTNSRPPLSRAELAEIAVRPLTIAPGDSSVVTIRVLGGVLDTLMVTYEVDRGRIEGSGGRAVYRADSTEGVAWITVTLTGNQGSVTNGQATVNVFKEEPIMSVGVQALQASSVVGKCLLFSAVPSETLFFLRALIENPVGQTFEILGSPTLPAGAHQPVPLQEAGQCYTLQSGTWNFQFTLQRVNEQGSFVFNVAHIQP